MGRLSPTAVKAASQPGRIADGDGLFLVVQQTGSKSWIVRVQKKGTRRDFGLGSAKTIPLAKEVNAFRNRVAHHEPILDQNVPDIQSKITTLISLRCPETATWVRHFTTIGTALRTRPRKDGSPSETLASKLAPNFVQATKATTLDVVMKAMSRNCQVIVCSDDEGRPIAAVSALDLTRFIISDSEANDGLFEPKERTLDHLLKAIDAQARTVIMSEGEALKTAIDELRKAQVDCQSAFKSDPLSARKRAPLRGGSFVDAGRKFRSAGGVERA